MEISTHTFWGPLCAVRLHCDVRVEMVQRAIGLFASVPAAFVHALDFLVAPARALVLLRAGDGNKRVDGRQRVPALDASLVAMFTRRHRARKARLSRVWTYCRRPLYWRHHGRRRRARRRGVSIVHARLGVLPGPFGSRRVHGRRGVPWVVLHVVVRCVRRVLLLVGVGWASRGSDRWIYRYIGVRLEVLRCLMVI